MREARVCGAGKEEPEGEGRERAGRGRGREGREVIVMGSSREAADPGTVWERGEAELRGGGGGNHGGVVPRRERESVRGFLSNDEHCSGPRSIRCF